MIEGEYEKAKTVVGTYELPAGYIHEFDGETALLTIAKLREMNGHDEDILSQEGLPFADRFREVLGRCLLELSDDNGHSICDATTLSKAPAQMLVSDLTVLLMRLRQLTVGDVIQFKVNCENPECKTLLMKTVRVSSFDIEPITGDPMQREREIVTSRGNKVVWKMMTGEMQSQANKVVKDLEIEAAKQGNKRTTLAKAIKAKKERRVTAFMMVRVKSINGEPVTYQSLGDLPWAERQDIRDEFDAEGGIDTDVEVTCDCGHTFVTPISIDGSTFFSRSDE